LLSPNYRSTTVPKQENRIYHIDIIELSGYFMVSPEAHKMLHIVTIKYLGIIISIYIGMLLYVASTGKIVAHCNNLRLAGLKSCAMDYGKV